MVRISGDFWVNFNDGNSLRSTFLLSPEHIFSLNKSPDHILRPYFIPEHRDFGKSYWNQALFQNKQSISQHFWVLCIPTAITGTCQKPKIQWFMGSIGSDRTPAFRKAWKPFEFWSFWSHTSKRILPDFLSICVLLAFAFVYWFFFCVLTFRGASNSSMIQHSFHILYKLVFGGNCSVCLSWPGLDE